MRISARPFFHHPGHLYLPPQQRVDPRSDDFSEAEVDIDLRGCAFVGPEAALWCVVYSGLAVARGSRVRLHAPEDGGVRAYLHAAGLFRALQEAGIEADDRGAPDQSATQTIVPIVRFSTETEAETIAEDAVEALMESGLASANMYALVSNAFGELAMNAVQHAESSVGSYGLIQFYNSPEASDRFVCAVADGGIGIRQSLERNPALRDSVPDDRTAIEQAIIERVTTTGSEHRGIGLTWTAQEVLENRGRFLVHSGAGALRIRRPTNKKARQTNLFPGTLASATIAA